MLVPKGLRNYNPRLIKPNEAVESVNTGLARALLEYQETPDQTNPEIPALRWNGNIPLDADNKPLLHKQSFYYTAHLFSYIQGSDRWVDTSFIEVVEQDGDNPVKNYYTPLGSDYADFVVMLATFYLNYMG